jgi:type IV pilus assembly protein PilW
VPTADVVLQTGAVAAAGTDGFLVAPYANPVISIAGFHTGTVSTTSTDTLTLSAQVKLPKEAIMPTGMQVYWLKCIMYKVIHASSNATTEQPLCGGTLPCLVRGTPPCLTTQTGPACVPVVDGIEDLQLSYACDGCVGTEDGVIDDQAGGTANAFDANDFVSNNAWNSGAFLPKTIRMVQVSVVSRQVGTTLGSESVGGAKAQFSPTPLVVQDHNHASGVFAAGDLSTGAAQGAYSQIMRRVLNRTVQLKNMGLF